jgi:hypothetical protein
MPGAIFFEGNERIAHGYCMRGSLESSSLSPSEYSFVECCHHPTFYQGSNAARHCNDCCAGSAF